MTNTGMTRRAGSEGIRTWLRRSAIVALAAAGLALNPVTPATAFAAGPASAKPTEGAMSTKDVLVLRNGKQIEGTILEETESSVKIKFVIAGISGENTYQKSEILSITRAAPKTDAPMPKEAMLKDVMTKPTSKGEPKAMAPEMADPAKDDGKAKVYVINMTGEFGRDISSTPMIKVIEDVKKFQPDVLVLNIDQVFERFGVEKETFDHDLGSFDQLETAREISTLLTDRIRDDPEFKTKPRLVAWVKKAMGGAAFLPFVCPEVYFYSNGLHGGIGYLDKLFDGVGDEVVREKQRSLRLARAEGLANKGGHDPIILRAMARSDFVLSVRFVDGKPEFLERMPDNADEILLTNDGSKSENQDGIEDILRGRGKNVLTLNADISRRVGFSRGTADTLDELVYAMGVGRDYVELKTGTEKILKDWSAEVTRAEEACTRLWRDYQDAGTGPGDATAKLGKQKRILQQLKSVRDRFKESINPRNVRGVPPSNQIQQIIDDIDKQLRRPKAK